MGVRKFSRDGLACCQAINKSNKQRCKRPATHQRGALALCQTHYNAKLKEKK